MEDSYDITGSVNEQFFFFSEDDFSSMPASDPGTSTHLLCATDNASKHGFWPFLPLSTEFRRVQVSVFEFRDL